jgi:murein L,D-transpeptidase YcbB/YkuD
VTWIDRQLSIVQRPAANPDEKQIYNGPTKKEIRAFQMTAGLVPDGIVGPKTIICLANATGAEGPSLINNKKGH